MDLLTASHKIWQWLANNPLVGIAALVTILVGLLSILKEIGKGAVKIRDYISRAVHWYFDRKVFLYMKSNKKSLHYIKDLSVELRRSQTQIYKSLNRLQELHKVKEVDATLNMWGLHDFQD